jgi:hypothetical protein
MNQRFIALTPLIGLLLVLTACDFLGLRNPMAERPKQMVSGIRHSPPMNAPQPQLPAQ